MKNTITLVFAAAAIVFGGICLYQGQQLKARQIELAGLRQNVQEQAEQLDAVKTAQERLKRQRLDIVDTLEATSSALDSARETAAHAASNAAVAQAAAASARRTEASGKGLEGFGGTIAKMLENPEMKKMIAQQQRAVMDTMYGPLFKELGLSKEQTDQFKELLLAQQMKGVEQAGTLFGGKADAKDKAEMARAVGEATRQSQDEIKAFLGEERYSQYKEYTETLGERMQLNQLTQQLANSQNPVTPDQQNQLLNIMKEERKTLATDFASLGMSGGQLQDPTAAFSEDKMNQVLDLQENLSQRVYDRAKVVLQPDQLDAFGSFQTNQLSMQRLGIKMFQGMMGENKQPDEGAPQPRP